MNEREIDHWEREVEELKKMSNPNAVEALKHAEAELRKLKPGIYKVDAEKRLRAENRKLKAKIKALEIDNKFLREDKKRFV